MSQIRTIVKFIHYACPLLVSLYFFCSLAIAFCTFPVKKRQVQESLTRKKFILGWVSAIAFSYFIDTSLHVARGVSTREYSDQDEVIYSIATGIFYGVEALILYECQRPVWYPYFASWILTFIIELILLVTHLVFYPIDQKYAAVILIEKITRVLLFVFTYIYLCYQKNDKKYSHLDTERQSLLSKKSRREVTSSVKSHANQNCVNSERSVGDIDGEQNTGSNSPCSVMNREDDENIRKHLDQARDWVTYVKKFTIFFPYLWPYKDRSLQLRAVLVVLCLLGSSALNVLVPKQMGTMIDSLTKNTNGDYTHYFLLPSIIYTLLRFANSGSGIGWLRQWLWNPIERYSYDALSTASHSHIMSLSSDFHDSKNSSDLSQAVLGGRSVTLLLETVCLQIVPMSLDLIIAVVYLTSQFGPYMGLILMITIVLYFYATAKLYVQRAKKRRNYINMFRKEISIGQESLDGWITASLFNMIFYEKSRYACAVREHMESKHTYDFSSQLIDITQGLILASSLLSVLWIGIYQVIHDGRSVGQFTTLLVYWAQLSSPLVFFSTIYRSLVNSMIDAEHLLELFQTKPTIVDPPSAKPLELSSGLVNFNCVFFAYDPRKPILKNISFTVPPGKKVGIVGETGGGKSTLLKLLDRLYDVDNGSISIDGQDIRNVTLSSLREKIGVVPQDPILFNDTIINNVRYAKLSATNEEIFEACRAAAIHEKILSFPDGYDSKVGDRGMKLSGGEKQRIAIARVILKRPEMIILDEATSAVDTETEQSIQRSFNSLCEGRTTFIVAHRLSTIMNADCIYVLLDGEIVEKGSHEDLILNNGKYHQLWLKQNYSNNIAGKPLTSNNTNNKAQDLQIIKEKSSSKLIPNLNSKDLKKDKDQFSDSFCGSSLDSIKASGVLIESQLDDEIKEQGSNTSIGNSRSVINKNENSSRRLDWDKLSPASLVTGASRQSNWSNFHVPHVDSTAANSHERTLQHIRYEKINQGIGVIKLSSSCENIPKQNFNLSIYETKVNNKLKSPIYFHSSNRRELSVTDLPTLHCNSHEKYCQAGTKTLRTAISNPKLKSDAMSRRYASNPEVRLRGQELRLNRYRQNRKWKLKNRELPTSQRLRLGQINSDISVDNSSSITGSRKKVS